MGERNRNGTVALKRCDGRLHRLKHAHTTRLDVGLAHFSRSARLAVIASFFALGAGIFVADIGNALAQPTDSTTIGKKDSKEKSAKAVPWKKIPDAEKKVLTPLEAEWSKLPAQQQRKLMGAAKEHPKHSPVEQERFQERLKSWSSLTPEQRNQARDKYQSLNNLPPEKQKELKARWQQEKQADKAATPATTAPSTPVSAK